MFTRTAHTHAHGTTRRFVLAPLALLLTLSTLLGLSPVPSAQAAATTYIVGYVINSEPDGLGVANRPIQGAVARLFVWNGRSWVDTQVKTMTTAGGMYGFTVRTGTYYYVSATNVAPGDCRRVYPSGGGVPAYKGYSAAIPVPSTSATPIRVDVFMTFDKMIFC